jgi:hypothetical protein
VVKPGEEGRINEEIFVGKGKAIQIKIEYNKPESPKEPQIAQQKSRQIQSRQHFSSRCQSLGAFEGVTHGGAEFQRFGEIIPGDERGGRHLDHE